MEAWFALRVRSNAEKGVALMLRSKGYTAFLPLQPRVSRWSDRNKQVDWPLFPGYVFSRFDSDRRLPLLTIPGVIHVVGFGKKPEPIAEEEITAVHRLVDSGLLVEPHPYVQVGEVIRVAHGAFAGLEGLLIEIKNRHRLVVSLTLLQRSVSVEIDRECVCPLVPRPAPCRCLKATA